MSAPATNLSARIRRLEAAKARADKLPARQSLSFKPMLELLGVSRPTLTDWCDLPGFEQSGCFVRGGNGIEWEFKARRSVDWLLKHFRKEADRQAEKSRALTKSIGVQVSERDEDLSLAEVKDRVNLTITLTQAAERQQQYVLASEMSAFLTGYNQRVLDGIMGVRTRVDPNGNLPPHIRREVDEYLRSVASEVHVEAARFIEEHSAGLQQRGIGRAG